MNKNTTIAVSKETDEKIREQLRRVLASKSFRQVDRLQSFLSFIVEEMLAGRGDKLKEFLIGVEVFGKESSFDPRMDPLVRVQARRLRTRLVRYYREEGQNDEVVIELPKGGYEPVFQRRETSAMKRTVSAALVSRNTILVRPFDDDSSSRDLAYFCSGLKQEIIHALSGMENLRVAASEHVQDGSDPSGQMNVAMIVTGSVRKSRDTLRITSSLIDSTSNCYLWSEVIDRGLQDELHVQEEVAQRILKKLQSEFGSGGSPRSAKRPTENLAAHNLYLQGRYHLNQRTEQGLMKAVEFFDKAISEDPHHAPSYSGLADAHGLLAHYGVLAPAEICTKAASNAAWAVLLDEESAEAHTSLAHVKATQDWDWRGAEREFQRAISLNPRYATAHHWYAMSCLVPLARLDEALEELLRAQALDPVSSIISRDLAVTHYYKRDFELALEQCDHTIEQNPHFAAAYWTLGLVQDERRDFDEAIAAFQRAIQLSPPSPRIQGALGRTFARAGKPRQAHKILDELQQQSKRRYVSPFELSSIYFALNQLEQGFQWLTKAFQDRCFELVAIKVDPKFDSVANDPRFSTLFNQLGLP
ncbi:MAG TPA: tetratricopeptide repeat protein [Candidatus Acidoferrales bacterium]|nr:tetratricopeptide repeat protein [Candidatus Acidoferrales bacterium]